MIWPVNGPMEIKHIGFTQHDSIELNTCIDKICYAISSNTQAHIRTLILTNVVYYSQTYILHYSQVTIQNNIHKYKGYFIFKIQRSHRGFNNHSIYEDDRLLCDTISIKLCTLNYLIKVTSVTFFVISILFQSCLN